MIPIITTFYRTNKQRLTDQIRQELSASKLAMALSWGLFLGVIPIFCGANIALGALVCWRFKLNHLLVQLISNLIYPLQILLFIPFIQLGVSFFSTEEFVFSGKAILDIFKTDAWNGIRLLGHWNLYGLLAWLLICSPFCFGLYFFSINLFSRNRQDTSDAANAPNAELTLTELASDEKIETQSSDCI